MAHVIEFYVPANSRQKVRPIATGRPGRVIEFHPPRRNRRNPPPTRACGPSCDAGQLSEAMEPLAVNGHFPGSKLIQLFATLLSQARVFLTAQSQPLGFSYRTR